jgi:hypothetical protein
MIKRLFGIYENLLGEMVFGNAYRTHQEVLISLSGSL